MLGIGGNKGFARSFKSKSSRAVPLFDGTAFTQIEQTSYEIQQILYKTRYSSIDFVPKGEIDMMAEPPQVKTTPIILEPLTPTEKREQAIELLSQLFSSGRPLSEVLDQAKQLVAINAGLAHELTPIGEAEPVPATTMDRPSERYVDFEHNSDITERLLIEKGRAFRLPQLAARTLVWLVPVIGLGVLAAAAATAVFANLPIGDVISVGPTLTANPVVQPSEKLPNPSPAVSALPGTIPETNNAALSAEEVAVLLARGDALVSRADVTAGRLFYERAVAAGNAEAAIRLGASYDTSFLAQARIRGVRADPVLAAYWYERARELRAVEAAEPLLKNPKNQ
jgi:hypothetical protein